jgi:predicted ATPase
MILNSCAGNHEAVIDLGMQALKHLGFNIDRRLLSLQIAKEILYGMILFRNSRLEAIKNAPIVTDKRLTNTLEILNIMVASAYMTDENLFALIVLKIGNLSARYGNSLYSPLGYAAYSLILGNVLGNFQKADKLKDISLQLAGLFGDEPFGAATYFCLGSFLVHWTSPARESLNYLQRALDCGFRTADYLYCGYALMLLLEMKYLTGAPLAELEGFMEAHEKYVEKINNDALLRSFAMFRDHINMLAVPDFSPADRLIEDRDIEDKRQGS